METKEEKRKHCEHTKKWRELNPDKAKKANSNHKGKIRFGGMKEIVLKRDGYKCTKCGMTNDEHIKKWGRVLTIQHKDNKGRYSKEKNNNLNNLKTLCLRCHGLEDWNK